MAFKCRLSVRLEASWPMSSPWMKLPVSLLTLNSFPFWWFRPMRERFSQTLCPPVHAAVIAINEAVDKGQASVTMAALNNPNAMLRNTQEALAQDYQDTLSQAKACKMGQASGRVRSWTNTSVTSCVCTVSRDHSSMKDSCQFAKKWNECHFNDRQMKPGKKTKTWDQNWKTWLALSQCVWFWCLVQTVIVNWRDLNWIVCAELLHFCCQHIPAVAASAVLHQTQTLHTVRRHGLVYKHCTNWGHNGWNIKWKHVQISTGK